MVPTRAGGGRSRARGRGRGGATAANGSDDDRSKAPSTDPRNRVATRGASKPASRSAMSTTYASVPGGARNSANRGNRTTRFPSSSPASSRPPNSGQHGINGDPAKTVGTAGLGASTQSFQQRYQALKISREKERTEAIASGILADPDKPRTLAEAITPKGTCQDMCAEFERVERVVQNDVWASEVDPESAHNFQGSTRQVPDEARMVKKFRRAAAGLDEQLPSDLRPPPILQKTVDYLFNEVIGQAPSLASVHHFVWDRTRAIRNDFSIQQITKSQDLRIAISCYERIARFHIVSLHQLALPQKPYDKYDSQQEREQLDKTLLSLMQYYDDSRGKVQSANEAEFRAYCVIFQIQDPIPDLEDRVQTWPAEIIRNPRVERALKLYAAASNTADVQGPLKPRVNYPIAQANWRKFWALVESNEISYLMACVAEIYFNLVRKTALNSIWQAYRRGKKTKNLDWSLSELQTVLGFDEEDQVQGFCEQFGFSIAQGPDTNWYLELDSVAGKDLPEPIQGPQQQRSEIVEVKRHGRSLPAVISGMSVRAARDAGMLEAPGSDAAEEYRTDEDMDQDSQLNGNLFVPESPSPAFSSNAGASSIPSTGIFAAPRPQLNPFASTFAPNASPATIVPPNPFASAAPAPAAPSIFSVPKPGNEAKNTSPLTFGAAPQAPPIEQQPSHLASGDLSSTTKQQTLPAFTFGASPVASADPKAPSFVFGSPTTTKPSNIPPLPSPQASFQWPTTTQQLFNPSPFSISAPTSSAPGTFKPSLSTTTTSEPQQPFVSPTPNLGSPNNNNDSPVQKSPFTFSAPPSAPSQPPTFSNHTPSVFDQTKTPKTPQFLPAQSKAKTPELKPSFAPSNSFDLGSSKKKSVSFDVESPRTSPQLDVPLVQPSLSGEPGKESFPSKASDKPLPSFDPVFASGFAKTTVDKQTRQPPHAPHLYAEALAKKKAEKSAILDRVAEIMMLEPYGLLDQFVENMAGPLIHAAQTKVEAEESRRRADNFRQHKLMYRYGEQWRQVCLTRRLARQGRERRKRLARDAETRSRHSRETSITSQLEIFRESVSSRSSQGSPEIVAPSKHQDDLRENGCDTSNRQIYHNSDTPQLLLTSTSDGTPQLATPLELDASLDEASSRRRQAFYRRSEHHTGISPLEKYKANQTQSHGQLRRISPTTSYSHYGANSSFLNLKSSPRHMDTTRSSYFKLKAMGVDQSHSSLHPPQASDLKRQRSFDSEIAAVPEAKRTLAPASNTALHGPRILSNGTSSSYTSKNESTAPVSVDESDEDERILAASRATRQALAETETFFHEEMAREKRLHQQQRKRQEEQLRASQLSSKPAREFAHRGRVSKFLPPEADVRPSPGRSRPFTASLFGGHRTARTPGAFGSAASNPLEPLPDPSAGNEAVLSGGKGYEGQEDGDGDTDLSDDYEDDGEGQESEDDNAAPMQQPSSNSWGGKGGTSVADAIDLD